MSIEAEAYEAALTSSSLKIAVLGNCQMGHVTRCLQAFLGGDWPTNEWINLDILQQMADGRRDLTTYFEQHDKVFMQPWVWRALEQRYWQARDKVVLYPCIEFLAYHPDLVYITAASNGQFLAGPGGHYQSSIALMAWKCGLCPADAVKLYNRKIYRRLGYLDYWQASCDSLRMEGRSAGLPLDSLLQRWVERGCFMHSANHPKLFVIADIVRELLRREGIDVVPGNPIEYVRDYLADSVVWPVYPEVGEQLGLPGHYSFKLSSPGIQSDRPVRTLGLKEFVERSFALYSQFPANELLCDRLDLLPHRALMAELSTPAGALKILSSGAPVLKDARVAARSRLELPSAADPAEQALAEEARMLFRPESPFWYGSR